VAVKRAFDLRAWVEASRARQGLPARVNDRGALGAVAALVGAGRAGGAKRQPRPPSRPRRTAPTPPRTLPAT